MNESSLLNGFHKNNRELAWRYAFDPAYIEKNAVVDWEIEFEVKRQTAELHYNGESTKLDKTSCFMIQSPIFLKTAIFAVLRKILNMSRSQLTKMQTLGKLEIVSPQGKTLALKNAIGFGCVLQLKDVS